jgi:hypothetical protein
VISSVITRQEKLPVKLRRCASARNASLRHNSSLRSAMARRSLAASAHNEAPVPVAKVGSGFHAACDDLAALHFQTGQASENRNIAGSPANVRRREAKQIRRRLIEACDHEIASQDDDGNFNGIEDTDQIGRSRVRGRVVTAGCPETSPAAIERDGLSGH